MNMNKKLKIGRILEGIKYIIFTLIGVIFIYLLMIISAILIRFLFEVCSWF